MNKIFKSSLVIASLLTAGFLSGCEKEDEAPKVEKTAVADMAGEWYVKFEAQNAAGEYTDPAGDGRGARNISSATAATPCTRGWAAASQGYRKIMTSSTADSKGSTLLVTDIFGNPRAINFSAAGTRGTFYSFMVKANADVSSMTFSANDKNLTRLVAIPASSSTTTPATPTGCTSQPAEPERDEDFNITITDGKILKGGSVPASGTTTDSIVFFLKLGNDPANRTYRVSGYRRTGFVEDEH